MRFSIGCIRTDETVLGVGMEWKPYLNYKDLMLILEIGKSSSYRIIEELRKEPVNGVPYEQTYEATSKGKKDIPTEIFLRKYPYCRKALKKSTQ